MRSLVDLILSSLLLPLTTSAQDTFLLFVSSHDGPLTDILTVVFSILLLRRSSDVISSSSFSSSLICLYLSITSRNFLNSLPCKKIRYHFFGWTISYLVMLTINAIFYPKISVVHMLCLLATGYSTVFNNLHGTLVVLM